MSPPQNIDGLAVVIASIIDERHRSTGAGRHVVAGVTHDPAEALAICFESANSFYLFRCDRDWRPWNDTWHASIEEAKQQAEFEYKGVSRTWQPCDWRQGTA